jgi:hypothetical protein
MTGSPALVPLAPRVQALSVLPVWVLALVGAVIIALATSGDGYFIWIPIVFAISVIVTFLIQLATRRTEGFVTRGMASIGGAMIILAAATGLLALLR